jgi:hypothetical protein
MRFLATSLLTTALLYPQSSSAQVERWTLVPELRIGSLDDPENSLTNVTAIAIGPMGNVFVAQPQEHQVRVFRSDGPAVRVIGREGEGPGEFSDLLGPIGFLGDTLWVSDGRLQRVSFFDQAGNFIRSTRTSSPGIDGKFLPSAPMRMLPDGTALVFPGYSAQLARTGRITRRPLLRISRAGAVLDTLLWLPAGGDQISIVKGEMVHFTSQPFADEPLLAVSPSGERVVVVERKATEERVSGHFQVTQLNAAGDTIFSRRYRYAPISMPKAYVDSVVAAKAEAMAKGPSFRTASEAEGELRKVLYLPSMRVPITGMLVGNDGSIWLKREDRPGETQVGNVLTADGEVLATLSAPRRLSIRIVDDNSIWGVVRDEFDVPYVVRYGVR